MNCQQHYELALQELTARLVHELGDQLCAVVIYGSVARGEADSQSDIDLLLIGPAEPPFRDRVSYLRYQVDLHYETLTTLLHRTPQQVSEALQAGSDFIRAILAEGVALYDDGTFRELRDHALRARVCEDRPS